MKPSKLALSLAACLGLPVHLTAQIRPETSHRVLAKIQLNSKSALEFVAMPNGLVGVAEHSPSRALSALLKLTAKDATALEAFIAVAKGSTPPSELVADHYRTVDKTGRTNREPRRLAVQSTSTSSAEESYDPGGCVFSAGTSPGDSWFTEGGASTSACTCTSLEDTTGLSAPFGTFSAVPARISHAVKLRPGPHCISLPTGYFESAPSIAPTAAPTVASAMNPYRIHRLVYRITRDTSLRRSISNDARLHPNPA